MWAALLPILIQDPSPAPAKIVRVLRVNDHVAIVEHTGGYDVKILNREGQDLANYDSGPGVAVVDTGGSDRLRLGGSDAVDLATAADAPSVDSIDTAAVTAEEDGFSIENTGATHVVAIVDRPEEGENRRVIGATVIGPGQRRRVRVPMGFGLTLYRTQPPACSVVSQPTAEPSSNGAEVPVNRVPATDLRLNTDSPSFLGYTPYLTGFFATSTQVRTDDRESFHVDKFGTISVVIEYEEKDLTCFGLGHNFNFSLFQVFVEGFYGEFKGEAKIVTTQIDPPPPALISVRTSKIEGTLWGIRAGAFWPALVFDAHPMQFSLGPEFSLIYVEETIQNIGAARIDDVVREVAGSAAARLSASCDLGGVSLSAEVSGGQMFHQLQGGFVQGMLGATIQY
jgi:hypothetical protein